MSSQILVEDASPALREKKPKRKLGRAQTENQLTPRRTKKINKNSSASPAVRNKSNQARSPVGKGNFLTIPEEGDSPQSLRTRKNQGNNSQKRSLNGSLRQSKLSQGISLLLQPLRDGMNGSQLEQGSNQSGSEVNLLDQDLADGQDGPEKREKDSDEDSSDVQSMMKEMDPAQRHIKALKIKIKEMERKRLKPLPMLSQQKRGWNAPLDKPYVPVGRMTELVSAVEQVRVNLPHTRERFMKQTYRQMLMVKKRERDLRDKQRKHRQTASQGQSRNIVGQSMSQSSIDEIKLEDQSRVVSKILPKEKTDLVQVRNFAYDQKIEEMHNRRQSAPIGPQMKFGRIAAGYVNKLNEKRDEMERKKKLNEAKRYAMSPKSRKAQLDEENRPKIAKSDIELQMEKEKSRHWIRNRNGRIYDEKIKGLILQTDNGSSLLKQEIQESEGRLAAVKLGKHLNEVVPNHSSDYFLTDKEEYFLGEKRILRRQEKEDQAAEQEMPKEPEIVELGNEFQTIYSGNEIQVTHQPATGGFFLTEQPMPAEEDRTNMIRIPDLLESNDVMSPKNEDLEKIDVTEMFQTAKNKSFEQMYRATTSHVKGLYLKRVQSRGKTRGGVSENLDTESNNNILKHQRANSLSTAAATTYGFYRSGGNQTQNRLSEGGTAHNTIPTNNPDSGRLMSAMTEMRHPGRRHGSHAVNSAYMGFNPSQQVIKGQDINQQSGGVSQSLEQSMTNAFGLQHNGALNVSQGAIRPNDQSLAYQSSTTMGYNAKRLLKDARSKRAMSMTNALHSNVESKKNRVRYLQGLQKERTALKKLDQAKGSKLFEGFSKDEMLEILIEMPELKIMEKEKANLIANGPFPPQFSNTQLIHLDSLNDIANRGKAELRNRVMQQIDTRKNRIEQEVKESDQQNDLGEFHIEVGQENERSRQNAAIMKKFQQQSKDKNDDDGLEPAFNFHDTLKERLNLAYNKQQKKILNTFKGEDWTKKMRFEGNDDGNNAFDNDDRANSGLQTQMSQKHGLTRNKTLMNNLGQQFNDKQQFLNRQNTSAMSQTQLRRSNTLMHQPAKLQTEFQRQIEDELLDFDHSDQQILMKLIEVYEARMARKNQRLIKVNSSLKDSQNDTQSTQPQNTTLGSQRGSQINVKKLNSNNLINIETDRHSIEEGGREEAEIIISGLPSSQNGQGVNLAQRRMSKIQTAGGNKSGGRLSLKIAAPKQESKAMSKRISSQNQTSNRGAKLSQPPQIKSVAAQSMNARERKQIGQLKKDYRKFVIEFLTKEYWRAFEALVGSIEIDLDLVVHSFKGEDLYKTAREFLVVQGKFLSDSHMINLKEDPKTILNLYRMHMLHHKTNLINTIDRRGPQKKRESNRKQQTGSQLSHIDGEDSDYSDSDFQDLMSNKQIEENIRVFFDRMHELVNPIDQQRLKLDSVQQIKSTVKTFYKHKADIAEKLLAELDQMRAERPITIQVKQAQFNAPELNNQANLHADQLYASLPSQQCNTRMTDIRLNAELFRLRRFKGVAQMTSVWYNQLATQVLAEKLQDEPLVLYMLDQIKHVIEMGEVFSRYHFQRMMATFDALDASKPCVKMVSSMLNKLLPNSQNDANSVGDEMSFMAKSHTQPQILPEHEYNDNDSSKLNTSAFQSTRTLGRPPKPTITKQQLKTSFKVTFN